MDRLFQSIVISTIALSVYLDYSTVTLIIILLDYMLCWYLFKLFKKQQGVCFLLHPILSIVAYQMYDIPFMNLGDGPTHLEVFNHYVGLFPLSFEKITIFDRHFFTNIRQQHLSVIPVFITSYYLTGTFSHEVLYFTQALFGVIYTAIWAALGCKWKIINNYYLLLMALFVVLSPSFFELRNNFNRYDSLVFGLALFYISFTALSKKYDFIRLMVLVVAIFIVLISKYFLILPIILFLAYYYSIEEKKYGILIPLVLFLVTIYIVYSTEIIAMYQIYQKISSEGGGRFGYLANEHFFSPAFKIVFALLSPFPWQPVRQVALSSYGGNYFTFVMHVFSAFTGIYLFILIVIRFPKIIRANVGVRLPVMFGLFLSSSVLMASTGYHFYILISFPFFIHLVSIKAYKISYLWPIGAILLVQFFYVLAINFAGTV